MLSPESLFGSGSTRPRIDRNFSPRRSPIVPSPSTSAPDGAACCRTCRSRTRCRRSDTRRTERAPCPRRRRRRSRRRSPSRPRARRSRARARAACRRSSSARSSDRGACVCAREQERERDGRGERATHAPSSRVAPTFAPGFSGRVFHGFRYGLVHIGVEHRRHELAFLGEGRDRLGRGDLHRVVDAACARLERAAEKAREAERVVHRAPSAAKIARPRARPVPRSRESGSRAPG